MPIYIPIYLTLYSHMYQPMRSHSLASGDSEGDVVLWDVGSAAIISRLSDAFGIKEHQGGSRKGDTAGTGCIQVTSAEMGCGEITSGGTGAGCAVGRWLWSHHLVPVGRLWDQGAPGRRCRGGMHSGNKQGQGGREYWRQGAFRQHARAWCHVPCQISWRGDRAQACNHAPSPYALPWVLAELQQLAVLASPSILDLTVPCCLAPLLSPFLPN